MHYIVFFAVSFFACVIGRLCGLGGGVIIKPTLDAFGIMSIASISFISSCTVLIMTSYSVYNAVGKKEAEMDMGISTPMALGAAVGGISGKALFSHFGTLFENPDKVGMIQAVFLLITLSVSLIFALKKDKIKTYKIKNKALCVLIGFLLGNMSSFVGGGSGPINMTVLAFLFTMSTKTAVVNSLYIILFSQITSLAQTIVLGNVPPFDITVVIGMGICAVLGSQLGRIINRKLDEKHINNLFIALMVVLLCINAYNIWQYM